MGTGNPNGRPPKYKKASEMEEKINEYFELCIYGIPYTDENGNPLRNKMGDILYKTTPKAPNMARLALALGFISKQSLYDYIQKAKEGKYDKDFLDCLTRAQAQIEAYITERLDTRDGFNGARFVAINCYGMKSENANNNLNLSGDVNIKLDGKLSDYGN